MGLYVTDETSNGGFMHAEAGELARKLRDGDGILWQGDPRLELGMETLAAPKSMWFPRLGRRVRKGEILARRYAVTRHNEDGSTSTVGTWRLEEFDRILMDLAPLRLDAPGHVDALEAIDKHNDALEKERDETAVAVMMEDNEHRMKLWADTTQGKTMFRQVGGMRDETPEVRKPAGPGPRPRPEPAPKVTSDAGS